LNPIAIGAALIALDVAPSVVASPAAPTPAEVCGMLSGADVKELLGKPAKAEPKEDNTGSTCLWLGDHASLSVTVETDDLLKTKVYAVKNQTAAERFEYMKKEVAAKRAKGVPGIGDDAVWQSNLLWVLKGKKVATISINRKGTFPADDLPGAKAAAAKVVAKL
jgi:hypothetical protein